VANSCNLSFHSGGDPWHLTYTTTSSNTQRRSSQSGREFEEHCNKILQSFGWTLNGKKVVCGYEIDQVATKGTRCHIWIEYKGALRRAAGSSQPPGCGRTDSLKKAVAGGMATYRTRVQAASATHRPIPFWVVTSDMPTQGRGQALAQEALDLGMVSRFVLLDTFERELDHYEMMLTGKSVFYGTHI
jgi:hypothetical protein